MEPFANLNTAWFALIGVLWAGYLFLEGFDFGVAVVTPFLVRDELDRRLCLNAVGPTWDGNEVWLLVAGGATFAAFPLWYARLFSGFYLALFLILLALIARGVSFEFRDKDPRPAWRSTWDWANFLGSLVPAIVWGVAFTDLVHGLPLGPDGRYTGGLLGLLHPIALLGGVTSLVVFASHGATFLSLKTTGELSERAERAARLLAPVAMAAAAGTFAWVAAAGRPAVPGALPGAVPLVFALVALLALAAHVLLLGRGRQGFAFLATGLAILATMAAVFARMFPAVLASSSVESHTLTIGEASAGHLTLVVMTVVAGIFTPLVLAYQGWTYWVFRARLVRPPVGPADVLRESGGATPTSPAAGPFERPR
ncbi:MAG TPA: cytochrome d ubiquinol oxidase subunit II [Acidimicrobiales bacterium]|nr:cytochrome d ubiquinol oxidase subunit II [Acidimicrobiales bacterium]